MKSSPEEGAEKQFPYLFPPKEAILKGNNAKTVLVGLLVLGKRV